MRKDDEFALLAFLEAWDLEAGLEPALATALGIDADEVYLRAARLPGEAMPSAATLRRWHRPRGWPRSPAMPPVDTAGAWSSSSVMA